MSKSLLVLLLTLSLSAWEDEDDVRVLGGTACAIEDHPYAASLRLRRNGRVHCGGTLVAPAWIMTAAHCLHAENPRDFFAVAGTDRAVDFPAGAARDVARFVTAPLYDDRLLVHDIGLVLLQEPYATGSLPKLARLPSTPFGHLEKANCTGVVALGWGNRKQDDADFRAGGPMQCVGLPVVAARVCRKLVPRGALREDNMCTLYAKGGKDTCQGDSGGPLVCKGVVVGITSKGVGCGNRKIPSISTRVDHHLYFISQNIDSSAHGDAPLFILVSFVLSIIKL